MTARCALYGCPENFRESLSSEYADGYFGRNLSWAFVPIDPMNVPTNFEVRTRPIPEIIGGIQKCGQSQDTPALLFSQILMGFCPLRICVCPPNSLFQKMCVATCLILLIIAVGLYSSLRARGCNIIVV